MAERRSPGVSDSRLLGGAVARVSRHTLVRVPKRTEHKGARNRVAEHLSLALAPVLREKLHRLRAERVEIAVRSKFRCPTTRISALRLAFVAQSSMLGNGLIGCRGRAVNLGVLGTHDCIIFAMSATDILSPYWSTLSANLLRPAHGLCKIIHGARLSRETRPRDTRTNTRRTPDAGNSSTRQQAEHTDVLLDVGADHQLGAPHAACMRAAGESTQRSAPGLLPGWDPSDPLPSPTTRARGHCMISAGNTHIPLVETHRLQAGPRSPPWQWPRPLPRRAFASSSAAARLPPARSRRMAVPCLFLRG